MVCIVSDGENSVVFHDCSSFLVIVVSDHFSYDPAVAQLLQQYINS